MKIQVKTIVLMFLSPVLFTGCITRHSEEQSVVCTGENIRGTERVELSVASLECKSGKEPGQVVIVPGLISRVYQVEKWTEISRKVTRQRFLAVAGIHDNYDIGMDVFGDFFVAGIIGPVCLTVGTLGLCFGEPEPFVKGTAAIISILPFISAGTGDCLETVVKRAGRKGMPPEVRHSAADGEALTDKRIDWEVYDPYMFKKASGRVKWPQEIKLPLYKWVQDAPEIPCYTLRISSKDIDLLGEVSFRIGTGFREIFPLPKSNRTGAAWNSPVPRPRVTCVRSLPEVLRPVSYGTEPMEMVDGLAQLINAIEFELYDGMNACLGENALANLEILKQWTQIVVRSLVADGKIIARQKAASAAIDARHMVVEDEFARADSAMKSAYEETLTRARNLKRRSDRSRERLSLLVKRCEQLQASTGNWRQYYEKTYPLVGDDAAIDGLRKGIRQTCDTWCETSLNGRN